MEKDKCCFTARACGRPEALKRFLFILTNGEEFGAEAGQEPRFMGKGAQIVDLSAEKTFWNGDDARCMVDFTGTCQWSVRQSLLKDAVTMRDPTYGINWNLPEGREPRHAIPIHEAARLCRIAIEIWGANAGSGTAEHFLIDGNGEYRINQSGKYTEETDENGEKTAVCEIPGYVNFRRLGILCEQEGIPEEPEEEPAGPIIVGIVQQHGPDDYELDSVPFTEEERKTIEEILMKHLSDGVSVRGDSRITIGEAF